jgi:hypothetical protein
LFFRFFSKKIDMADIEDIIKTDTSINNLVFKLSLMPGKGYPFI